MAVGYDTTTILAAGVGDRNFDHTPIDPNPKGVLVLIACDSGSDLINGVTCDGMVMVEEAVAVWASGETGSGYAYFLGSGIPSGQALTIAIDSAGGTYTATCTTYTADGDTEIAGSAVIEHTSLPDPSVSFNVGEAGREVMLAGGGNTGQNFTSFLTALAGYTNLHTHDFGTECAGIVKRDALVTADGTGTVSFAPWDCPGEEIALAVVAIGEILPPAETPGAPHEKLPVARLAARWENSPNRFRRPRWRAR